MREKLKVHILVIMFVGITGFLSLTGCSHTDRSTRTTTTTVDKGGVDMDDYDASTTVTTETTAVEETPEIKEDHSILGSFFHFVGNVIAFPFRLIGSAFDAIF